MLTMFWDSKANTVISVRYCDKLRNELKPAIRKIGEEDCRPHSAVHTKETFQELKF
jgi:hypothetical protein